MKLRFITIQVTLFAILCPNQSFALITYKSLQQNDCWAFSENSEIPFAQVPVSYCESGMRYERVNSDCFALGMGPLKPNPKDVPPTYWSPEDWKKKSSKKNQEPQYVQSYYTTPFKERADDWFCQNPTLKDSRPDNLSIEDFDKDGIYKIPVSSLDRDGWYRDSSGSWYMEWTDKEIVCPKGTRLPTLKELVEFTGSHLEMREANNSALKRLCETGVVNESLIDDGHRHFGVVCGENGEAYSFWNVQPAETIQDPLGGYDAYDFWTSDKIIHSISEERVNRAKESIKDGYITAMKDLLVDKQRASFNMARMSYSTKQVGVAGDKMYPERKSVRCVGESFSLTPAKSAPSPTCAERDAALASFSQRMDSAITLAIHNGFQGRSSSADIAGVRQQIMETYNRYSSLDCPGLNLDKWRQDMERNLGDLAGYSK